MPVLQHKVVAALPVPLQPNSIYYVRNGTGFDQYVTNSSGVIIAYPPNKPVLVSDWVDLRPYLVGQFYFDASRNGRNSPPRLRKHSDGLVELDGAICFNSTAGPTPTFTSCVSIPTEYRTSFTTGGVVFTESTVPLNIGYSRWIAMGQQEYQPPYKHGDIIIMPDGLANTNQGSAIILNGMKWYT